MPFDTIKNAEALKRILSSRVADFVTFIFLTPTLSKELAYEFEWCTKDHYPLLNEVSGL